MKNNLTLFFLLFLANTGFTQELDFKLIDKLINISFDSIDQFMIDGYGFTKLREENEGQVKIYARIYNNDDDSAVFIRVISPKDKPNTLDIKVGKNYNIRAIKDKLLSDDYEYSGTTEYGLIAFKELKSTFLISNKPNNVGATQIIVITEW